MFCNASLAAATDGEKEKLTKLVKLWEKSSFFGEDVIEKLENPNTSWTEYQSNLVTQYAHAITPITVSTKKTYDNYQAQHQAFISHARRQIDTIEQQKITIEQLKAPPPPPQMV